MEERRLPHFKNAAGRALGEPMGIKVCSFDFVPTSLCDCSRLCYAELCFHCQRSLIKFSNITTVGHCFEMY